MPSALEAITGGVEAPPAASGGQVGLGGPYQVTFAQRDPPHRSVTAKLHDKPPTPTEGGGGWEEVALPKRSAVLIWKGRGLLKMSIPIVFDGFAADRPVGSDYEMLLHFWRPIEPTDEPAILNLHCQGDAVPYQQLDWVVSNLEWGEAEGDEQSRRTQQMFIVTVTEHRADERLQTAAKAKKKGKSKPYTVRAGDTLGVIAEHHHISLQKLREAQRPPIHDPRHIHVGQRLIIPGG